MIKAFIFDLDGTLFNTTEANIVAYKRAFEEESLLFDEQLYRSNFGLRFNEMIDIVSPDCTEEKKKKIKEHKKNHYKKNFHLITLNQGLLTLLQHVDKKYLTALATTASKKNVQALLKHFDIEPSIFNVIITGEEVENGKPHPECYQKTIKELGVKPNQCIIFEDSSFGIESATKAGANVIKVVI